MNIMAWSLGALLVLGLSRCGGDGGGQRADQGLPDQDAMTADVPVTPPDLLDLPGSDDASIDDAVEDAPGDLAVETGTDTPEDLPDAPGPDATPGPPYWRHVNPFIGTGGELANVGSALPGATAPFGLVKVSPDTRTAYGASQFQHCAGYHYEDDLIAAFTHNHLHGTGAPDYGNIGIMPVTEMTPSKVQPFGMVAPFTHEGEEASPGYYAVTLLDPAVRVELTATTRCAHHRYTWIGGTDRGILALDPTTKLLSGHSMGGEVHVLNNGRTIEGWNHATGDFSGRYGGFPIHFTLSVDRDPVSFGTWLDGLLEEGRSYVATSKDPAHFGAWLVFNTATDPVVEVQVCLSYVDLDGARNNRRAEMPVFDFEGTREATREAWERELARIEVQGGTPTEWRNFYTAIYHALQMPTIWSDADGRFRSFDRDSLTPHVAPDWTYYTDMSLWDTFRTAHPLYQWVWPDRQRDMLRSLAVMMATGGWTPQWPMGAGDTGSMIGQHAASVFGDWVAKGMSLADLQAAGIPGTDPDGIWTVLRRNADGPAQGPGAYGNRDCIEDVLALGYCPSDRHGESVSLTLEYAFNDFCMAEIARSLGQGDDENRYRERAGYWRNLWHPETGFFRPRLADGTFDPAPFDPTEWNLGRGHYVEGSAWQWTWFVPHDPAGLREVFGGDEAFRDRLRFFMESFIGDFDFLIPSNYYFQGNEPDLHAPFLATEAGRPEWTERWSRFILDSCYRDEPGGLIGNDDGGTLAAWYVFAAIGLYPWPCLPHYTLTAPIFDRVTVHLPSGDLRIEAPGAAGRRDLFVQAVRWNGTRLSDRRIDHRDLARGGTLTFEMGSGALESGQ
ncbi:MAG TPA: GH92 family glycosyl hydrolase [Myxococcota bacterium]|nr:GH92 family glycosyl hydrolase [Myxococcota bacterium]HQK52283.1 GH92 family glycosyl hydrolase [Myxococcota bacterium]